MKSNKKCIKILLNSIAFLFAVVFLVAALPGKAHAAGPRFSNIKIEGTTADDRLEPYTSHHILGKVSSGTGYNLQYVEAVVYDYYGKKVTSSGVNGIGKGYYTLKSSTVDNNIKFAKLAPGEYELKITAADIKGNKSSTTLGFRIASNLKMKDLKVSTKYMTPGCSYNIYGKITSDYKITRVRASIQHFIGQEAIYIDTNQVVDYKPNTKTIDIVNSPINKNLKFGALPASKYVYQVCIQAWDASGTTCTEYIEYIFIR